MAIQFGNQHAGLGKWRRGVYKIIFDNKWYYIGSSVDVYRRLCAWKHHLQKGEYTKNRSIGYILPNVSRIDFEIIEFVRPDVEVKWYENKHIHRFFNDEYCLNISDNAFDTIKDKKYLGYVPRPKIVKGEKTQKVPLVQYDVDGNFIAEFSSIREASAKTGLQARDISRIINGERVSTKGYKFAKKLSDGIVLEPTRKGRCYDAVRKRILCVNKNGLVDEYESIKKAAETLKIHRRTIEMVLLGRYKQCKGFRFQYA